MLQRIARDGPLDRFLPWEGRTVRSLVARTLLKREALHGTSNWVLTAKARDLIAAHDGGGWTGGASAQDRR